MSGLVLGFQTSSQPHRVTSGKVGGWCKRTRLGLSCGWVGCMCKLNVGREGQYLEHSTQRVPC